MSALPLDEWKELLKLGKRKKREKEEREIRQQEEAEKKRKEEMRRKIDEELAAEQAAEEEQERLRQKHEREREEKLERERQDAQDIRDFRKHLEKELAETEKNLMETKRAREELKSSRECHESEVRLTLLRKQHLEADRNIKLMEKQEEEMKKTTDDIRTILKEKNLSDEKISELINELKPEGKIVEPEPEKSKPETATTSEKKQPEEILALEKIRTEKKKQAALDKFIKGDEKKDG